MTIMFLFIFIHQTCDCAGAIFVHVNLKIIPVATLVWVLIIVS